MARQLTCPAPEELKALLAGQLPPPTTDTLLRHLEKCDACGHKVEDLTGRDTLVDLIRQADTMGDVQEKDKLSRLIDKLARLTRENAMNEPEKLPPAMQVHVVCGHCQKKLKVKSELQGKKVKCPGCGQAVLVAAPVPAGPEEKTLAPASVGQSHDSQADSIEMKDQATLAPTADARPKGDYTQAFGSPDADEATDFLAPPQGTDEIGHLGPYRILKVLGKGGMGVVFQAEDPLLNRTVALKAMLPSLAASASARQRFLREARAAAALQHDHIVTIHQVGEDRGAPFIAMEFLKGEPLDKRLEHAGKLSIEETVRIGREMAQALEAAHEHGLIHRDIKPANVWLQTMKSRVESEKSRAESRESRADKPALGSRPSALDSSRVKILDFGLARAASEEAQLTQQGAIIGTPAYMAPEQAAGKAVDARCDLFSLGCVLYRLCTGVLPFKGSDTISTLMAVSTETPPAPEQINPEVPQELAELIMKLLEKKADDRYQTATEVVEALRGMEEEASTTRSTGSPIRRGAGKRETGSLATSATGGGKVGAKAAGLGNPGYGKARRKVVLLAAAAGIAAAIVAAVFIIRLQTSEGEFHVEVEDDQVAVAVDKQGGLKLIHRKTGKEYLIQARKSQKLPAGDYDLVVIDPATGLEVSTREVTIMSNGQASARVTFKKKDDGGVGSVAPGNNALEFDGNATVEVALPTGLKGFFDRPFTVEALVTSAGKSRIGTMIRLQAAVGISIGLRPGQAGNFWCATLGSPNTGVARTYAPMAANPLAVRLAFTSDGKMTRLFVDGKLVDSAPCNETKTGLNTFVLGSKFVGQMDDIRLSTVCRYTADYTPGRPEKDNDTLALYHCDEGQGDKLVDSSGNGHHGKIEGAKWVRIGDVSPAHFALHFDDDNKKEIRIPEVAFKDSTAVTLEAYAMPTGAEVRKLLAAHGLSLILTARQGDAFVWSALTSPKTSAYRTGVLNKRVHIAAVLEGTETRLYLDGELVGTRTSDVAPPEKRRRDIIIGPFSGVLSEIRVSRSPRYTKSFTPAQRFVPDEDTVALYHCDEGQGNKLVDSSGNGHHGKIEGAKWVKVDGSATTAPPAGVALRFAKVEDKVVFPTKQQPQAKTITIEGWFLGEGSDPKANWSAFGTGASYPSLGYSSAKGWRWSYYSGNAQVVAPSKSVLAGWTHVAGVKVEDELRLFINGKLAVIQT